MNKKGFSLIELLVVIVLIAIISIVAFVNFGNQAPKGRNTMRINNLGNIQTAIEFAKADQQASTVWTSDTGGTALTSTVSLVGTSTLWLNALAKYPTDPNGASFIYGSEQSTSATKYQIAASLEQLDSTAADLGTYHVSQNPLAAIVGNFVETVWSVSLSWTGMATVTGTPTPQQMGLIARKTALGDYTANVVVVTGKTNNLDLTNANRDQNLSSVVIDGSVVLPY